MKKENISIRKSVWALGILFAVMHFLWVLSVAIFGEDVNFIASVHFINPFSTLPFNFLTAILGIVLAFLSGALIGWFFAWTYNKIK